jgi:hypothetical protein
MKYKVFIMIVLLSLLTSCSNYYYGSHCQWTDPNNVCPQSADDDSPQASCACTRISDP